MPQLVAQMNSALDDDYLSMRGKKILIRCAEYIGYDTASIYLLALLVLQKKSSGSTINEREKIER